MHAPNTVTTTPVKRRLLLLLLIALSLRAGWAIKQPTDDASFLLLPDQQEYVTLARNLLAGDGLTLWDKRFNDSVRAFRMPGYPLFVAAMGENVRVVRLAQALIDTSTVLAIYLLARRWLSSRASLIAATFVALNPFLIYFSGLILSETLFTALLAWGMCLLVWPSTEPGQAGLRIHVATKPSMVLAGGLLLALSVLVRQSALPLPVMLGIAAAFANRGAPVPYQKRWPLPIATTMVLLTGLVLLPWAWRNSHVMGQWIWTTTNGGITAYDGFNPDATGASEQKVLEPMLKELSRMSEIDRDQYLSQLARTYVQEHPQRAMELAVAKIKRTWSPVPLSEEYQSRRYWITGLAFSLPFDLLVLAGLIIRRRAGGLQRAAKMFLVLPAVYFTCVHALSVGSLRYRIPFEPPMAILGAVALGRVLKPRPEFHLAQS